jgi:AAA domain, putative AbiEii toxin, Type IV TA system
MHIREIHIENIRCFGEGRQGVHLDLTRPDGSLAGWTVLAGRNGTGKSTLLRAIALAVAGPDVARSLRKSFADWIREGKDAGSVTARLVYSVGDDASGNDVTDELVAGLEWKRAPDGPEPAMQESSLAELQTLRDQGPWKRNPWKWFIAGYGPFRRIGYRDDYEQPGPPMEARLASLFDEDVTLAESVHWLRDLYALRLDRLSRAEKAAAQGHAMTAAHAHVEASELGNIYKNVISLLNDGLLPEGSSVVGLDMRQGLLVEQNGVIQPLRGLSDGYRAAIALVFDVIRQLHRALTSPLAGLGFEHTNRDGRALIQIPHEGVVLIDEVDAHLHISWQQRIGFWLKEHFPNVQFIVTTHSPFICQAADPKGLIRLPAPGSDEAVEHVSEDLFNTVVYGDADDAVMTALFGLDRPHSDKAERLRRRVAHLEVKHIRGAATPAEQEELKRLSALLPKTGNTLVEHALRKLGEMP